MTGFGDARGQNDRLNVTVEVRSVNNRYLKIVTKSPERYQQLDGEIERIVRESITRGTVNVVLRVEGAAATSAYRVNGPVLELYWRQLGALSSALGTKSLENPALLLGLPGVIVEGGADAGDVKENWPLVESVLRQALAKLQDFRRAEGASMEQDLRENLAAVAAELDKISAWAPQIVRDFRDKLHDRVQELLRESEVALQPSDLIREVSIFAERCDISEEIVRLRSHLEQFQTFTRQEESQGRKLEFLTQEMGREANTIGSKANCVDVAHSVVEIKGALERIREVMQNVE
jgi:uncharacterized protein (TIGR00255 family)